jgi:hypothetical protein
LSVDVSFFSAVRKASSLGRSAVSALPPAQEQSEAASRSSTTLDTVRFIDIIL